MRTLSLALGLLLVAGCASDGDGAGDIGPTTTAPSATPTAAEPPTIEGRFPVSGGRELAIQCIGEGSPVIILEPGTDGSGRDENALLIEPLAEQTQTTTCTYDRTGFGLSDPPTQRRRTIDDASADLHDLVAAAELAPPYLLVGPSGGGLLAINYAARYRDQVAGIVLLDTPAPLEDLSKEFPGSTAWKNPEHLDYAHGERTLALNPPKLGDLPISIVTATDGASSEEDQSFWLALSTGARQTTLTGEHDLTSDNQGGVIGEIQAALDRVRG